MALETKPLVQIKTGIWVNRNKMRVALDKISFYYGIIFAGGIMFSALLDQIGIAILLGILGIPMGLIQWSYSRFKKMEKQNEKE